jgi:hypothetical protein
LATADAGLRSEWLTVRRDRRNGFSKAAAKVRNREMSGEAERLGLAAGPMGTGGKAQKKLQ